MTFFVDTQRLIMLSSSSTGHLICVFIVSMAYRQILDISQLLDNMSCSIFIMVIFWWLISENGGWITKAIHVGGWHSHLLLMDLYIYIYIGMSSIFVVLFTPGFSRVQGWTCSYFMLLHWGIIPIQRLGRFITWGWNQSPVTEAAGAVDSML